MDTIESIRSSITASRALCAAASPGPWKQNDAGTLVQDSSHCICEASPHRAYSYGMQTCSANTSFIAHARQALPAHVDALELAVAALESIEEYWNRSYNESAAFDACEHAIATIIKALAKIAERLKENNDGKA